MIITPSGNRNGVLGLLNVNSRFKAPTGKSSSDAGERSDSITGSAEMGVRGGFLDSYTDRIVSIQGDISRSQAREEALQDISGSLQSLRNALADSSAKNGVDLNEFRGKVRDAVSRTYDGVLVVEDVDPEFLGIGFAGVPSFETVDSTISKVSQGLDSAREETARLTAEVKSLEVSRENFLSSDNKVREAEFAGELLSITTRQIGFDGNQELIKGVNFDKIMKLIF